jgi:hypothetical protein
MPAPVTDQLLPEYEDFGYTEPPKSAALYVDATKWIVGLATGSFLLTGTVFANHSDTLELRELSAAAIGLMALAVGWGVRALQCYTRVANMIEVNAVRKPFEVSVRNDGDGDVRWATKDRVERCRAIPKWLKSANRGYFWMTWSFALGVLLYVAYVAVSLVRPSDAPAVKFSPTAVHGSPVLGIVHDEASHADCIVVKSVDGLHCLPAVPAH